MSLYTWHKKKQLSTEVSFKHINIYRWKRCLEVLYLLSRSSLDLSFALFAGFFLSFFIATWLWVNGCNILCFAKSISLRHVLWKHVSQFSSCSGSVLLPIWSTDSGPHSFFIRILFFWSRLNILIFLPILCWKYSYDILLMFLFTV